MKSTIARTDEDEMLKILSDQAPVGVCIMQDGKFCYVNSNFPLTIGYTIDELLGKDSSVIVFPEDREAVRENTANAIRDAEGRVVSCLALAKDVTKRKQIEEKL